MMKLTQRVPTPTLLDAPLQERIGEPPESPPDKPGQVLAAIESSSKSMATALGFLVMDLSFLREYNRKRSDWVTKGEKTLVTLQPQTLDKQQALWDLQKWVHQLDQ
ncbi:hypothetical protein NDU88_002757 [Pleurodeles waltl]|uniref:Uncharacterized protein n=1 Tax=Pleurodeles waltl TaxID=8319 RepID=A0AAV7KWJ0_PLEWA|nr:hypothetical protein NDU88_002757 [Pleurodeles waltl]